MPPKFFLLADALRFILNHPLNRHHKLRAIERFIRWQVGSRLAPGPVIIPFIEQTRLVASPGLMGATGIYYTGLYEFEEMAFVLHTLRPQDRFIDIGAHIGAFSVLAAGAVGAGCIAIEPVPASFCHLQENLNLNGLNNKVKALNIGIAGKPGRLLFTSSKGAANGVVPPGKETKPGLATVEVEVQPLDAVVPDKIGQERAEKLMLKVDVEGFEHEVIAGGGKTLADERLFAILIELRGHGARYGFDESAIHQRLITTGFRPYSYVLQISKKRGNGQGDKGQPRISKVTPLPDINQESGTTIYIRDLNLVQQRLATAPNFFVHGQYV